MSISATANALESCHYKLDVTVSVDQVNSAFQTVQNDFIKHASLPGFRKGKTPRNMINRRFGQKIQDEVRQRLLSDSLQTAIKDQNLKPVGMPEMPDASVPLEEGKEFQYSVELDVAPEFDIPDLSKVELKKYIAEIDDKKVDDYLNQLAEQRASYDVVERASEAGDMLKVSYSSDLGDGEDDVPEAAKRLINAEETWVLLSEPEMFPGIIEGLQGLKADEEKELEITFPDSHYEPFVAGTSCKFTCKILEVHGKSSAEINDAFAESLGVKDLEELKAEVRKNLENQLEQSQSQALQGQVLDQLADLVDFELPKKQLDDESHRALHQLVDEAHREEGPCESEHGVDEHGHHSHDCKHYDDLKEKAEKEAADRLRVHYLIQAIAEKEDIKVDPGEMQQMMGQMAQFQQSQNMDQYSMMEMLHGNILRRQVLDKIIEEAKVVEEEAPADDQEKDDKDKSEA